MKRVCLAKRQRKMILRGLPAPGLRRGAREIWLCLMNLYKPVTPPAALKGPGRWAGSILSAVACAFEGVACHYIPPPDFTKRRSLYFWYLAGPTPLAQKTLRGHARERCLIWGKTEEIPDLICIRAAFWSPVIFIACLLEGVKCVSAWFMIGALPAFLWMVWEGYMCGGMKTNRINASDFERIHAAKRARK